MADGGGLSLMAAENERLRAELATLRERYAEAVRALAWTRKHHECALAGVPHTAQESLSFADSALGRPEAQEVLRG